MIVNVQFKNRRTEGFGRQMYSYLCMMDVKVGDLVKLPTVNGDGIGRVAEINVSTDRVDSRILPKLKCITEYAEVEKDG